MIIGIAATSLTFIFLVISIAAYYQYYKTHEETANKIARYSFYISSGLIILQGILLMWGLLSHQYQWAYVMQYSSNSLSTFYLVSTFWAGQEGTFVLWLIFGVIYGWIVIRLRSEDEPLVMIFMNLVQAAIVIILIKKNPFEYIWNVQPNAFPVGASIPDGNGLNPLLQDPWMIIHPPILFAGYSSTMLIFAFAMTALIKRDYDTWIKRAFPFAVFVGLSLGAGIILGGYWAYTTLGWGGYWGWDPVENSSLIPWLTSLALIHGIVIQNKQGGMKKTNIFLALTTFILVLYGSFLTRSGVLTDFSVHSFGASEVSQYLLVFVVVFTLISLIFFVIKIPEIKGEKVNAEFFTRENFTLFGVMVLLIFAVLTFVGTSSPILTSFFGEASNVSTDYYNTLAAPIAMLIALLLAITPVLSWRKNSPEKINSVIVHAVLSVVLGIVIFFLGMKDIQSLIITILSLFAILVSGHLVFSMIKKKNYHFGGLLAHLGIGLMIIGIITSSVYDKAVKTTLPLGEKKTVFGYELEYAGRIPAADGKDKVYVKINGEDSYAKFYWSEYSRAYMVSPSVRNQLLQDLYVSPIQIIPAGGDNNTQDSHKHITLEKNKDINWKGYILTLQGYDMNAQDMMSGANDMGIAALIHVLNKEKNIDEVIKPLIQIAGNQKKVSHVELPGSPVKIYINGINVENKSLDLAIIDPEGKQEKQNGQKELLAAEISVKPLINILWLGTIIMVIGFFFSLYHRRYH